MYAVVREDGGRCVKSTSNQGHRTRQVDDNRHRSHIIQFTHSHAALGTRRFQRSVDIKRNISVKRLTKNSTKRLATLEGPRWSAYIRQSQQSFEHCCIIQGRLSLCTKWHACAMGILARYFLKFNIVIFGKYKHFLFNFVQEIYFFWSK